MRKHIIDQRRLGDKVISYSLAGLSLNEIAEKLARECGVNLSKASISRWLTKHGGTVNVALSEREAVELSMTLEGVKKLVAEVIAEIERRLPEFESNPERWRSFLKLKLEAIDRMMRLTGSYQPETLVSVKVDSRPIYNQQHVEASLKAAEEYFRRLESEAPESEGGQ